jgi:cell shape-determining protein MreD
MFASFVQGPLVRVIPLGLILLALQRTIFVEIQVGGVIIQIMMAMAAAAGVAGGSERGAIVGFIFGVMFDLAEGTPLGSTATAMTIAGAVGGLLALIAADPHWWLEAIFTALGTATGVVMIPVVRSFIGEPQPFEGELGIVVIVVAAAGAVLSPLLVPLGRWCLRMRRPEWKQPIDDPTV